MTKRLLVTAGSTAMMIDRVRKIDNIFRGRTGEAIAREAAKRGWIVTLLTSAPVSAEYANRAPGGGFFTWQRYRTFDDLHQQMERIIAVNDPPDVVVHSAAVSDYEPTAIWSMDGSGAMKRLGPCGPEAGKVASGQDRLFLEMRPTIKLIDQIRQPWGFTGLLVKFKLQVGMSDGELLQKAEDSRRHSDADFIVANCLEWSGERALIIDRLGLPERVKRLYLADRLLERIEASLTPNRQEQEDEKDA